MNTHTHCLQSVSMSVSVHILKTTSSQTFPTPHQHHRGRNLDSIILNMFTFSATSPVVIHLLTTHTVSFWPWPWQPQLCWLSHWPWSHQTRQPQKVKSSALAVLATLANSSALAPPVLPADSTSPILQTMLRTPMKKITFQKTQIVLP